MQESSICGPSNRTPDRIITSQRQIVSLLKKTLARFIDWIMLCRILQSLDEAGAELFHTLIGFF